MDKLYQGQWSAEPDLDNADRPRQGQGGMQKLSDCLSPSMQLNGNSEQTAEASGQVDKTGDSPHDQVG